MAVLTGHCNKKTIIRDESERNNKGCGKSSNHETKELALNRSKARVYDIRNAGQHNRFTVSGHLVHNCGYGGSVGALKAMGALEMGLKEEELQPLVDAWRQANPAITKLWRDVDKAAMTAVSEKTSVETHGLRFSRESGFLFITLPSGRRLAYVKPIIGENRFGSPSITYEGTGATKKWERLETFGGKLVENIVQAIARDILCYAMNSLRNYGIVAHVHDELIIEAPPETSLKEMSHIVDWENHKDGWSGWMYGDKDDMNSYLQNMFDPVRTAELSTYVAEMSAYVAKGGMLSAEDLGYLRNIQIFTERMTRNGVGKHITDGITEGLAEAGWDTTEEELVAQLDEIIEYGKERRSR